MVSNVGWRHVRQEAPSLDCLGIVMSTALPGVGDSKLECFCRYGAERKRDLAVVNYRFHDGGINREGCLQQRFTNERAAHKFSSHFHTGQTVSLHHVSVWPYLSTLEFEPTILHTARKHRATSQSQSRFNQLALPSHTLLGGHCTCCMRGHWAGFLTRHYCYPSD